jgi:hypothetical protein
MSSAAEVPWLIAQLKSSDFSFIDKWWEQYYPFQAFPRTPTDEQVELLFLRLLSAHPTRYPGKYKPLMQIIARSLEMTVEGLAQKLGREWQFKHEEASVPSNYQGEAQMSQKPNPPAPTAKPTVAPVGAKPATNGTTEAKPAKAKAPSAPREGKGPGGLPWVKWFQQEYAKGGVTGKELQDKYIELRKGEYVDKMDVLKRHAYRHRKLALPNVE